MKIIKFLLRCIYTFLIEIPVLLVFQAALVITYFPFELIAIITDGEDVDEDVVFGPLTAICEEVSDLFDILSE